MNQWRLISVLLASLVIASCDVPETVELPVNQPKPVLNLITQDNVKWWAKLTLSKSVLEALPTFQAIPNAFITIFEDGQLLEQLQFVDTQGYDYYVALVSSPVPGRTYSVEASAPSYSTVSAEYRHPDKVLIDTFDVETLGIDNTTDPEAYKMRFLVTFVDPSGSNYYSIAIKYKTEDSPFPSGSGGIILFYSNPAYEENKEVFHSSIVLTDQFFEGVRVTLEFEAVMTYFPGEGPEDYPFYTVYLQNMSEDLYEYEKAIYAQALTEGEPFAQPIIVRNNIKNGFGIFGGFTETEMTYEVE